MNLKIFYINFLFLNFCTSFANDDVNVVDDKKIEKKELIKRLYRWVPSYMSIGFDSGQFLWTFITCNPNFIDGQENYKLDFRGNFLIDFNRLLLNVDIGFLKKRINSKRFQEHSLLLRINCLCNLLKKNSEFNSIFIGGGININGSRISAKEYNVSGYKDIADNEKFGWFWINVTIGFRKSFCKNFIYFGGNIILNFCKKELFTRNEKCRAIEQEYIYGFGGKKSSLTPSFNIYIGANIPLGVKDKRVEDEEFYFYKEF